jgi:integrase
MIKRAHTLGQPSNLPLCVYRGKGGKLAYLTASAITKFLRRVAKKVHLGISKTDLNKISAHSLRVWAACLLHEAGQSGDYIKKRLRWLSECYRIYLRDSDILGHKHNEVLESHANLVSQIQLSSENIPDDVDYRVSEDPDMGDYIDLE